MTWSLYNKKEFLKPLKFSNGKTQEDIVKEVLDSIKEGHKVIFIHGICGTGKSAVALNIAKEIGRASVVVPGKTLQSQYKRDYEGEKYLLKNNKEKLRINVMTGRNNHKCKFLEDNKNAIPIIKKEVNSKLNDIFEGKRDEVKELIQNDISADNNNIPCKIEIKEKNWQKIVKYLKQNKDINPEDFTDIKDVKRASIANVCPYWSPVLPDKYEIKSLQNRNKREYLGLKNTRFIFYPGKSGCSFYEQFNSFIDSDVVVFNSLKYLLESALDRKPATEIEIIDEGDEFLDRFSNQRTINLDRIQNSLIHIFDVERKTEKILEELNEIIKQIKRDKRVTDALNSKEIIPVKETGIYDLLKLFLNSPEILEEIDEESYLFDVEETAKMFGGFFEESYVMFSKKEENLSANIVTINLAKRFKDLAEKNKIIVLMSGTLHSEKVLRSIFGLEDFKIIEAETQQQGNIEIKRTGMEMDCRYDNFAKGNATRENYLKALDKCIEVCEKPVLIHVNSFSDLPDEREIEELEVKNTMSRDELKNIQKEDKTGREVDLFKKGQKNILFSTKCSRGVDFPGEQCKSIVFTKYPNPNVEDAFWKILRKVNPTQYWDFYKDKARRELWQKIYRGLRFKEDHIFLLSPDIRVLDAFEE